MLWQFRGVVAVFGCCGSVGVSWQCGSISGCGGSWGFDEVSGVVEFLLHPVYLFCSAIL